MSNSTTSSTKKDSFTKPNIVILLADDMGWGDVGYHNPKVKTPNIDRLVKEGIELDRFYVSNMCTPSRAALLTGRYPGRAAMTKGVITPDRMDGLSPDEFILPEMLGEVGYQRRACIGKWHLGHSNVKYHPINQGFTHFYGHYGGQIDYFTHERRGELDWHRGFESDYTKGYSTDLIADESVRFIEESNEQDPFFLYVPFNAPHSPLQSMDEELALYNFDESRGIFKLTDEQLTGRNVERGRGNSQRQTYMAMVSSMDKAIGRILKSLEDKGIADNTLVMFYSDNGADPTEGGSNLPLKGRKGNFYEGGVRAPAVIKWPAYLDGKRKLDNIMGHIDIFPTLASLLGFNSPPKAFDGKNIMPLLRGEKQDLTRTFYLGRKGILTNQWKYVNGELYDIKNDPLEKNNLASSFPEEYEKMQNLLKAHKKQVEIDFKPDKSYKIKKEWKMMEN